MIFMSARDRFLWLRQALYNFLVTLRGIIYFNYTLTFMFTHKEFAFNNPVGNFDERTP